MLSVLALSLLWAFLPRLVLDWDELEATWEADRRASLAAEGSGVAETDSLVALERRGIRWQRENMPWVNLAVRAIYALAGGFATWAVSRALGWAGRLSSHFSACALAQGAYVLVSSAFFLIAFRLSAPLVARPGPALLFAPGSGGAPLHGFLHYVLESFDVASVATVTAWGIGLGRLLGLERTAGLRLCFAVYVVGVLLVSSPILLSSGQ